MITLGQKEEVAHDPKRVHHHSIKASDITTSRGIPVVAAQQHRRTTVAIPVNLIGGPQEVNLRLAPISHGVPGRPEILIKAERT